MSSLRVDHTPEFSQNPEIQIDNVDPESIEERVSRSSVYSFGKALTNGARSLGSWIFKAVKVVAEWTTGALRTIFGCGTTPENNNDDEIEFSGNTSQEGQEIIDILLDSHVEDEEDIGRIHLDGRSSQELAGEPLENHLRLPRFDVKDPPLQQSPKPANVQMPQRSGERIIHQSPNVRTEHFPIPLDPSLGEMTGTSAQLVPYAQVDLSIGPSNILTPRSLRARLFDAPQLVFRLGKNEYWMQNPVFGGSKPDDRTMKIFRRAFADMMSEAAVYPYYDMQVGDDLIVRLQNPGYGRSIDGEVLQQHTAHQIKSLMNKDNSLALVKKNRGHEACPCKFCQQNAIILGSKYFQIEIGDEAHRVKNPFSSPTPPSDKEVLQFRIDIGRLLEGAANEGQLTIRLEEGPAVQMPLLGNKVMSSGQFGRALLMTADAVKTDSIARRMITQPEKGIELGHRRIELINTGIELPVIPNPEKQIELPFAEKTADNLSQSLQALAAQSYTASALDILDRGPQQSLYPTLDYAHGRNLLVHFIDESTTVWNQPEISLGEAVDYCIRLSESAPSLSEKQKQGIRIFFDKLKAVEGFDLPFWLSHKENLQRILSPRLDGLLSIKSPNHDQMMEIDLARAELATSFGFGIVPTQGGKNGAVFIKTFEGRSVGVFKAPRSLGVFDFIERMKLYFGQARLLSGVHMSQEKAEVVAGRLSRHLGFVDMAPKAIMASFGGEEGAFITFLDGYQELSKIRDSFERREEYSEEEVIMWQMKEIWNKLIGNLDPHDDNVFVKGTGEKLEKISMIDAGNSFPEYNPRTFGSRGNLAASVRYRISHIEFHPVVREFVEKHITEESLKSFLESDLMIKDFYTENMWKLQLLRTRLLRLVVSGEIKSPAELAMVQTSKDYKRVLSPAEY